MLTHARQRTHTGHGAGASAQATTASHGLHHGLHLLELLHKLVDFSSAGTRTARNTLTARTVKNTQVSALTGSHRAGNGLNTVNLALIEVIDQLPVLVHAGHHAQQFLHRAQLAHLLHLRQEIINGEGACGHLLGGLLGFFLVESLLGLLDQGEQVTHIQNARGHTVGVETLKVVQALTGGSEQHGRAGNPTYR